MASVSMWDRQEADKGRTLANIHVEGRLGRSNETHQA